MSNKKTIDIGKMFSRYPAGRFPSDGPFNGELFRNTILIPELKKNQIIAIELDDTAGYGSSFLEEAFGGLVREGISHKIIKNNIFFNSEDESLVEEINEYIDDAILEAKNGDEK